MVRIIAIVGGTLLVALAAWAGVLTWFDGERIRSAVGDRLSDRWGVSLEVETLERSFALRPLISAKRVWVANEKFSDHPLIEIESASFRIHPWSLLIGPVTLDELVVEGISVTVPVDDEGALYWDPLVEAMSNWLHRFDWSFPHFVIRDLQTESRHVERGNDFLVAAATIEGTMPRLAELALDASDVTANLATTLPLRLKKTARLDSVSLQRSPGELPVTLTARGRVGDEDLAIDAAGGNLLDGDPVERDPLRATIRVGPASADIRGTMSRDADMHLDLHVRYDEPAQGDRKALQAEARVSDPGNDWRLSGVRARQGDSTLAAVLDIRNRDGRRFFDGSATVTNVEYPEIDNSANRDHGDEAKNGEKAGSKGAEADAAQEKKGGLREVLPQGDLYAHLLEAIAKFDADFALRAERSRLLGVPFDRITLRTTVDEGALRTIIEDSRIGDSGLKGSFSVTPGEEDTAVELAAELRNADLSALVAGIDRLDGVTGRFDGDLTLNAAGREMPAVLGSTNGQLALYLDRGEIPDPLAERIAGDVFTAMFADFDENDRTPIRCAIVDFQVDGGVASARRMLMDTGEFLMFGGGRIDLREGTVDLEFVPRARNFSLVSISLPFRIHGPLDDVRFNPDVSEGVASLLTPVELGSKEEVSCAPPPVIARREETATP